MSGVVPSSRTTEGASVVDIFNMGVVAHAISAAEKLGIFDALLSATSSHRLLPFPKEPRNPAFEQVIHALDFAGIVDVRNDAVAPGKHFEDVLAYRGFFLWLFGACGRTLSAAGSTVPRPLLDRYERDGALVGEASGKFGAIHIDPVLLSLPEVASARSIADLGCGDGSRALGLMKRYGTKVVGIDVSGPALGRAREAAADAGFQGDLSLLEADVRDLRQPDPLYEEVECIILALLGHDLWPFDSCISTLNGWREAFPRASTLIICETVRGTSVDNLGIPSLGYEFVHGLMGQEIPAAQDWHRAFASSRWELEREERLDIPANTSIFICRARALLGGS